MSSPPETVKLVIVGGGGHGLVVADACRTMRGVELVGFVADRFDASLVFEIAPFLGEESRLDELVATGRVGPASPEWAVGSGQWAVGRGERREASGDWGRLRRSWQIAFSGV